MVFLIVFLPLFGAIVSGFFGKNLGDRLSMYFTSFVLLIVMVLGWVEFLNIKNNHEESLIYLSQWIISGNFEVSWSLRLDMLTSVMIIVITTVSSMVHVYSIGYMSHDKSIPRFMAYLSFFTFAMLLLVTSDNLIQLFLGWEGVGLASYLLIGFWHHKNTANSAAMKAFIVNRVGDFAFILGIISLFAMTGSVYFNDIFSSIDLIKTINYNLFGYSVSGIEFTCILLFIGSMGKSAQIGLHTWLPDAMEGPTPVSALIHAATMVTAGVFLLCRMSPLLEYAPLTLSIITYVGALTAIFAATIGLTQFDIKRVIAYSTCSQLGYMFFAVGVSAYPVAMFHLTTHAFFKALLFLGAGSVIHALSDEQDMRKMGGIWNKIPYTYTLMWIGSLALAGIPLFSGYYSKDLILESVWASNSFHGYFAFVLGSLAAFLTAFYSWRLIFLTFHGEQNSSENVISKIHESPLVMLIPLIVLAIGAIFSGIYFYEDFVGHHWHDFWGNSIFIHKDNNAMEMAHYSPLWVKVFPVILALLGIFMAYICYVLYKKIPDKISSSFSYIYIFFYNKWFFDELYNFIFVIPSIKLGNFLFLRGDQGIIDRYGPDGISRLVSYVSKIFSNFQSGYVYHYAFVMLIGLIGMISFLIVIG